MSQRLEEAITDYQNKLIIIEQGEALPKEQEILALLTSRDLIQALLTEKEKINSQCLSSLVSLDRRLETLSEKIYKTVNLNKISRSFHPRSDAWWWFLEPPTNIGWWDKYDKVWNGFAIALLVICLIISVDISSKFLLGEKDGIGFFFGLLQTSLTTLIAGLVVTEDGRKLVDSKLSSFGIPIHFRQESRLIASILLLVIILLIRSIILPSIGEMYNSWGWKEYKEKQQLISAKNFFERSLQISPDQAIARYNLGNIFEDINKFDLAINEYLIAGYSGQIEGFINAGRLYILSGDDENKRKFYDMAVYFSRKGLQILEKDKPQIINDLPIQETFNRLSQEYWLRRNYGWARMKQERYSDAKDELEMAIRLYEELKTLQKKIYEKDKNDNKITLKLPLGNASCLMAIVQEKLKEDANNHYWDCLHNLSQDPIEYPEDDQFLALAKNKILLPKNINK